MLRIVKTLYHVIILTFQFIVSFRMFKLIFWLCILQTCRASTETLNYSEHFEVYDAKLCNQGVRQGLDFTYHFFRDQFSLTAIDFSNDFSPMSSVNSLKCRIDDHYRPLIYYDRLELVKFPPSARKNEVSAFPATEGFILQASYEEVRNLLRIISSHNPLAKTLIMQAGRNESEARILLSDAFHVHKMLKVAVMMFEDIFQEEEFVTWSMSLMMYNPFVQKSEKFTIFDFGIGSTESIFDEIENFMNQRTRNLNGFPLTISMFDYPMLSKRNLDETGKVTHYSYADGEIVRILAKFMNFTPKYIDGVGFGFQYANGTFTGSLADVEEGRADLAGNLKFIANYNTSNSLFLQSLTQRQLIFIIRKRKTTKPFIFLIFGVFDGPSSAVSLFLSLGFPFIYMIINRLEQKLLSWKNRKSHIDSFGKSLISITSISFNVAIKKPPRNRSARILLSIILFYTLIMSTLFQSTILKNLNTNLQVGKIKSISQLADEGYKIKMPGIYALMFKEPGQNKVSLMLNRTKQSYLDVECYSWDLAQILPPNEKIAYLWSTLYKTNYLNRYFDNKTGENLFESIPEIAFTFYISQMVPKHSPFIENFNYALSRYTSSSLGNHHGKQASWDNDKVWMKRVKEGKVPKKRSGAINLNDIMLLFKIYLVFNALSCVVFMLEIITKKFGK